MDSQKHTYLYVRMIQRWYQKSASKNDLVDDAEKTGLPC